MTKQQELELELTRLSGVTSELEEHKKQLPRTQVEKDHQVRALDDTQGQLQSVGKRLKISEEQEQIKQQELERLHKDNSQQQTLIRSLEQEQQELRELKIHFEEAQSRIRMQDEDKQNLFSRYTDLKNEHHQLRQQCEKLTRDSLQFNEQFSGLVREKEALNQEIEHLNIEKHDYLGRLRAISSVIDAVGTELDRPIPTTEQVSLSG